MEFCTAMKKSCIALALLLMVAAAAEGQTLVSWGKNEKEQSNVPTGLFSAASAGAYHHIAIRTNGTLVGWGDNSAGQRTVPAGAFMAVAAGQYFSIGIRLDGTLVAWGDNPKHQTEVPTGTFKAVSAGSEFGLGLRTDGTLAAWGDNARGQTVVPEGTFTAISAGRSCGYAIRTDGTLAAWGENDEGETNVPTGTFVAVSAGTSHGIAMRADGTLAGWGSNYYGESVVPSGTYKAISGGGYVGFAIKPDNTLVAWGYDGYGETNVPAGEFSTISGGTFYNAVAITTVDASIFPPIEYTDDVTVDGNFGDWADATWKPFDMVYDPDPIDIADGSEWAVKWGAGGTRIYIAVKVNDIAHVLTDTYVDYFARDAVELYLHTTGTGAAYAATQEGAQEWTVGVMGTNPSAVWATVGYPPAFGDYTPSASEFIAAGHEDGAWLYYEAAITPYQYFGGRVGAASIVSPLAENNVIGCDVTAVGCDYDGYTGMKSSGHAEPGWSDNFGLFAQHRLVRSGVKGAITLHGFGASTLGAGATIVITDASSVSETHNLVIDGSGAYSFKTALRGNCTAVASATDYLPQSKPVVVDTDGKGSVNFTLVKESANLPTVGASNKAVVDTIMDAAAPNYIWVLWGKVSNRTDSGFKLDDGSGVIIAVSGTNSVSDQDYVSVKGTFDSETKTLTSQEITKHSP